MSNSFHSEIVKIIKKIPKGKVATYGQIAAMAGNPQASRQVAWVLNSSSSKDKLPWHRVINRLGKISLKPGSGYEQQREMLEKEGVVFNLRDSIDLKRFLWSPK